MDGGSTDGTLSVLKKYPNLLWKSCRDKGQSDAMNKAFALSSGDIILYLNADDQLKPDALQRFADAFVSTPCADMIVADLEFNQSGKRWINSPSINLQQILNYWPCVFPANPVSYAYKRQLQKKIGNFPLSNHYTMDYWFILRAFLKGTIVKIDFVAGTFNFDGTNKSADAANSKKWLMKVRNKFVVRYIYYPQVCKFVLKKLLRR